MTFHNLYGFLGAYKIGPYNSLSRLQEGGGGGGGEDSSASKAFPHKKSRLDLKQGQGRFLERFFFFWGGRKYNLGEFSGHWLWQGREKEFFEFENKKSFFLLSRIFFLRKGKESGEDKKLFSFPKFGLVIMPSRTN